MQIKEILGFLENSKCAYSFIGNREAGVVGYCSLKYLQDDSFTWIREKKNVTADVLLNLKERKGLLIVTGDRGLAEEKHNYIIVEDPKAVYFKVLSHFYKEKKKAAISKDSVIETEKIGREVSIGHHCYINPDVTIGDGTVIGNHVSIDLPCTIGTNVMIYSGVVIGTDGFGYYKEDQVNQKVSHFGGVSIGNDVEIGANTCIDRGTMEDTVICDHVKIDNLCHIGHNAYIGENSLITALTVLGGSCKLERNSYVGIGGVVRNQIKIGENAVVGMGSVVTKSVVANKVVAGVPAKVLYENKGGVV